MKNNLSAGRVQSVAVGIAEEKRSMPLHDQPVQVFLPKGYLRQDGPSLPKKKISHSRKCRRFLKSCYGAKYTVSDIQVKPAKNLRQPLYPLLQQEASGNGIFCEQDDGACAEII
jgi:DNA topoisomerase-1